MIGPVLDADGVAVTDCVVGDFKVSKNGAAPGSLDGSSTLTHRHTGHYSLAAASGDFDTVGTAQFGIDDTTNTCAAKDFTVLEEAVYDISFAASATGAVPVSSGGIDRASFAADTGLQSIRSNTAQAGGASTITLDASASAVDDFYNGTSVLTTGGTGAGQVRVIADYVGSTKVGTVDEAWAVTPDNTTTFAIFPSAASAADIAAAVLSAAASNPINANMKEINDVAIIGDGDGTPFNVA